MSTQAQLTSGSIPAASPPCTSCASCHASDATQHRQHTALDDAKARSCSTAIHLKSSGSIPANATSPHPFERCGRCILRGVGS